MRFTESMIRRIIKEEATRALREGAFPPKLDDDLPEMDAEGIRERYMIDIMDLFRGFFDPDSAKSEATEMIDDMCDHLRRHMNEKTEAYILNVREESEQEVEEHLRGMWVDPTLDEEEDYEGRGQEDP
jgi:hypothetical protein